MYFVFLACLRGLEVFLETEQEVDKLLNSITEKSNHIKVQLEELTREQGFSSVANGESSIVLIEEELRLHLLLWEAKSELFVQAVNMQAEKRVIANLQSIGAQLGTKLKERIYKISKYQHTSSHTNIGSYDDAEDYPLTYEKFTAFPLDHQFWNDSLYYHSKAPWETNPNVQAGIPVTLTLCQVKEEFQLLAQDLCWAQGWGVAYYNRLADSVSYISNQTNVSTYVQTGVSVLAQGSEELPNNHLDSLHMGGLPRKHKCKLILREMRRHLDVHDLLMDCCDLNQMMCKIRLEDGVRKGVVDGVDKEWEEFVLEAQMDDGEDAEVDLISLMENYAQDGTRAGGEE
ncbi:hypothetical protein VP01_3772g1 [Puccinia sorghi]|uniref:Uncharacterized protein n=1 Tax=Puccinia sorghi TaxID=27349 RepID=A0A0L6UTU2_9BASI|nr:hypothetical protein VP01_3772g1 [Puccinia sorghi]